MPPKYDSNRETRISMAMEAIHSKTSPSIRAAADVYDVPHSTLAARLRGVSTRQEAQSMQRKLSLTEEEALVRWILSMDERGYSPRVSVIRRMADILLLARVDYPTDVSPVVGECWVRRFINRHEQLKAKYTRKYDYQRALCEDPKAIDNWFRLVENARAKYGIPDEDVYNFDDTGFQMGVIGTARVATRSERVGKPCVIQPGNRDWVTDVECINATG